MTDIRKIKREALECRDNRCHWTRDRKYDERDPMWGTYRWDSCENGCGNWRYRIERSDGSITPNSAQYEYSTEYEKALEFTREDARLELNRRANARKKPTAVIRGKQQRPNLRVVA